MKLIKIYVVLYISHFAQRLNNILKRSRSYPNNNLSNYLKSYGKFFQNQSPSTSIHLNLNRLDPNNGMQTPGGSSSRLFFIWKFF